MNFAVGTDEERPVVRYMLNFLSARDYKFDYFAVKSWAAVALDVAHAVTQKRADYGIVCCFTGTGVTIAANKVHGIRAALCVDAQTAAGARKWNNANVLGLSLRLLSEHVAQEILEAWIETPYSGTEGESLSLIDQAESALLLKPRSR